MKKIANIFLVILLLTVISSCGGNAPNSKLTIVIVDESGKPIEGAEVSMGFHPPKSGTTDYIIRGTSDIKGVFSASHQNMEGSIAFSVKKIGYYDSHGGYGFSQKKNGKWEPWNPEVKVILRKIINPVPMFARKLEIEIPASGKDVGFDLAEYAWLPPYGTGKYPDFIFNLKRIYVDDKHFDCSLKIRFNKNDGIQEVKDEYSVVVVNQYSHHSTFKLTRYAPESGYKNELTLPFRYTKDPSEIKNNYVFRVRSKVVSGKITGMYGKIVGDIMFDPRGSKTASLLFKYYLNPDYTNNLEFDPKQNLFKDLKSFEQISLE